jgi:aryl-alcohol dehydrogenase-like predicted oxidoreductase
VGPNQHGLSRANILASADASLRRLRTDFIDVYQVHYFDPHTPIQETLSALDDLVRAGKVRYVGCCNFAAWQLVNALWTSDKHGIARFESVQFRYNLLHREPESELLPACVAHGVGGIAYHALAIGLLSGRYDAERGPEQGSRLASRASYQALYWRPENLRYVEQLRTLAGTSGRTPAELSIARVLAEPGVNAVLVGVDQADHLDALLPAAARPLTTDERNALDALRVES